MHREIRGNVLGAAVAEGGEIDAGEQVVARAHEDGTPPSGRTRKNALPIYNSVSWEEQVSVEDPGVVDIISLDKQTGCVTLTISDHLDWTDTVQHERLLEEKLNKYLAFVESGEILERYPEARG